MAVTKKLAIILSTTLLIGGTMQATYASSSDTTSGSKNVKVAVVNRVAVVDLAAVLQQSPAAKSAGKKLKSEFQPRQEQIKSAQKQLMADQKKLKRNSSVMSASDLQALQDKINTEGGKLQQMQDSYMQDLRTAQAQSMQKVLGQVEKFVKQVAVSKNYSVVLQKNAVAYNSDAVDITQMVIDTMNK